MHRPHLHSCATILNCLMSCCSLIRFVPSFPPTRSLSEQRHLESEERHQAVLSKDKVPSHKGEGTGRLQEVSNQRESLLRPPKKPERRRERASEVPARKEVDESIKEQLSAAVDVPSQSADTAVTASVTHQNSTSSVAEVISELPGAASSQSRTVPSKAAGSKIPSEPGSKMTPSDYAQDTFESLDSTLTPSDSPQRPIRATSTPTADAVAGPLPVGEEHTLSGLSESISGEASY